MKNIRVIGALLNYIRIDNGILMVKTVDGKWIPMIDYYKEEISFSADLLGVVDRPKELVSLRKYLYENFYIKGSISLSKPSAFVAEVSPQTQKAICPDRPEQDSLVYFRRELTNGTIIAGSTTSQFAVAAGQYRRNKFRLDLLELVEVFQNKPRTNTVTKDGWVFFDSSKHGFNYEDQLFRFYLNPHREVTEAIAHSISARLDHYGIQFLLKYFDPKKSSDRCDRIVMYVPRRYFVSAALLMLQIYNQYKGVLRRELPLFLKLLKPGIGFAEEPVGAESFGNERCLWIAHAVQEWYLSLKSNDSGHPPRRRIVSNIMKRQKLDDLDNIHLNPDCKFPYHFEVFNYDFTTGGAGNSAGAYLDQAIKIANFICREALWLSSGKCTWVTARADKATPEYRLMEKDWEHGLLGPVFFLATIRKYADDATYAYFIERVKYGFSNLLEIQRPDILAALNILNAYNPVNPVNTYVPVITATIPDLPALSSLKGNTPTEEYLYSKDSLVSIDAKGGTCFKEVLEDIRTILEAYENHNPLDRERLAALLTHVSGELKMFLTNEKGWDDFFPGMDGLSLVGFSFLLLHDSDLPPIPIYGR